MKRRMIRNLGAATLCAALLFGVAPAAAGVGDFTLTKAIPADAFLAVHARHHDGMAFLDKQWKRVWARVQEQQFEKDIRNLFRGLAQESGGNMEGFDEQWQQMNDLLLAVEWSTLFKDEFAFAMKLGMPMPEMIMVGRAPTETTAKNFEGIESIVKTLLDMGGETGLTLTTEGEGNSVVHTISVQNAPMPMGMMIAREGDVIMFGMGVGMPEQALAMLRGSAGESLAATDRFKAAFARLPEPRDELVFFDMARFMGQMRSLLSQVMGMAESSGQALSDRERGLPGKVMDAFDMFEYIASVKTTEGLKTQAHEVMLLKPGAKSKRLYPVFFGNGTIEKPLNYIPKEAENCTVWSGVDLRALYLGVLDFIREDVPDGENLVAQWEAAKTEMAFDIEADFLSWIGGEVRTFALPAKSAYQPGDWALMVSVKDEAKARQTLGKLFEMVTPMLQQQNGMLRDANIEGAEGFKIVVHPMLAMMGGVGQPTIGVHADQLFIGSGERPVSLALKTAADAHPSFTANERFVDEGLPVVANTMALSFTDQTMLGQQLGDMLAMIPMIGMFAPEVAQNPVGRVLMTSSTKLSKVARELNFFQSACSLSTFDGDLVLTKRVLNYREPPAPKPAGSETDPASPGDGGL